MNGSRKRNDTRYQVAAWGGVAALIAASVAGCGQIGGVGAAATNSKPAASENTPRVQTVSVEPNDLSREIELPGTVEGYETADLYAKVGGFLAEIGVDIGDHVSQGQVLARLSIPEMEKELLQKQAAIAAADADVEQSQAAIRQAQSHVVRAEAMLDETKARVAEKQAALEQFSAEFKRTQDLVRRGSLNEKLLDEATYKRDSAKAALDAVQSAIRTSQADLASSKADVDKAQTDYRSALAHVDLAKADYERVKALASYGVIRAPFDGMVTKRFVDPGAFIQPADGNSAARPLLTVTRIDVVRIWLDLPMAEVAWLDRGDRVVFDRINVLPGARFEGEITRFATALDRSSRMMRVEVDLPNPDRQLLPGYYGYVKVLLDEMPQTAVVPSSALVTSDGNTFVCVVANGVCERRPVSVVFQDGTIVGVGSGLRPGEQVIRSGGGQLREGQQVVAVSAGA